MKLAILIPTLNAGSRWQAVLKAINSQSIKFHKKIIIDSGSNDDTVGIAKANDFEVLTMKKENFDHGYSRQLLAEASGEADILIYLTQDCILADNQSIENLVAAFNDYKVAIAYGRQLPLLHASLLEAHSRYFNYPTKSKVKSMEDRNIMGIKTASCSDSFSAYNKNILLKSGGFPIQSIFGEDVIVGGRLLLMGWKIAYVAEATAYHSHDYTVIEEFKRFFDIGVFHATNKWLLKEFGKADGEGFKYIKSEFNVVIRNNALLLPKMFFSIFGKLLGYKLGLNHEKLPFAAKKLFSMHSSYWDKQKLKTVTPAVSSNDSHY